MIIAKARKNLTGTQMKTLTLIWKVKAFINQLFRRLLKEWEKTIPRERMN